MWCAVVLWCVCSVVVVCGVKGPPHIVVIMADDMGWNDVSFHGSSQIMTPNIDALAYQGVVLNRHYTMPTCSPSRAAFLTGRYSVHTGIQIPISSGTVSALSLNFTLLPQHLSRLGYRTHLVGKWHLGSHHSDYLPLQRGFHSHFGFYAGYLSYYDGIHLENGVAGIDAWRNGSGAWQEFSGHYLTDLLTEEAVSIIRSHESQKPLYLQVALSAPHTANPGNKFEVSNLSQNEGEHHYITDVYRRLYAGMVRGVDDTIGAIVEALRSSKMLDNSIILFTSDNGAPTLDPLWGYHNYGSNWPLRGMKVSCHEGGVRTAAALWSPLVKGNRVYDQLIHITDWLPTLYSAAGGDVVDLGKIDGVDQWGAMIGQGWAGKRIEMLVELNPINGNEALIKWPWKVVRYTKDSVLNTYAGESGRGTEVPQYSVDQILQSQAALALNLTLPEMDLLALRSQASIDSRCTETTASVKPCVQDYCLFNLEKDPCEIKDLSSTFPSLVGALTHALGGYRQIMVPPVPNTQDPRALPQNWQNYWAPWANTTGTGMAPPRSSLTSTLVICLLLLLLRSL
ncbi:arylsulfatase B-like [Homalodisca vitripennis]|uniref:arylsulfatase B-like n=1 Tax=Homalodisca vitripennis TaxID=197043 RepID=UPI001EEBB1EF|nr:arylsulfatase B-like [Homalodisca vitripennis]